MPSMPSSATTCAYSGLVDALDDEKLPATLAQPSELGKGRGRVEHPVHEICHGAAGVRREANSSGSVVSRLNHQDG